MKKYGLLYGFGLSARHELPTKQEKAWKAGSICVQRACLHMQVPQAVFLCLVDTLNLIYFNKN